MIPFLKSKITCINKQAILIIILSFFLFGSSLLSQVNYVNNPSFENAISPPPPNYVSRLLFWNALDTTQIGAAGLYYNLPNTPVGYCPARTGTTFIRLPAYCTPATCSYTNSRGYPRNRLKTTLTMGVTYCVKMYVSLEDISPYAMNALQIYFGDISMDTIKYCKTPLTYLNPQITNTLGIIGDTMNWVKVENTFTAVGNEKYLVIGCFIPDAAITRTATGVSSGDWAEYFIDDVSVIDFNLAADAGPDKNIILGDSAFIGRPPEVGLECTWATGTTTVGSGGGIWVKPTSSGTYSYVVTQNICGNIKTDTVNVNVSPNGINENSLFAQSIAIYPQPAKDILNISFSNYYEPSVQIKIVDVNGKEVENKELPVSNFKTTLSTRQIPNGVYILQITNSKYQTVSKRLIITR